MDHEKSKRSHPSFSAIGRFLTFHRGCDLKNTFLMEGYNESKVILCVSVIKTQIENTPQKTFKHFISNKNSIKIVNIEPAVQNNSIKILAIFSSTASYIQF